MKPNGRGTAALNAAKEVYRLTGWSATAISKPALDLAPPDILRIRAESAEHTIMAAIEGDCFTCRWTVVDF